MTGHLVHHVVSAVLTVLGLAPSASQAALAPAFYSAKEIRATVVDTATGRPIDRAVVVAVWQLETVSGEGPRLQVTEAVTDANGQFFVPGWGPKLRPPLTEFANKSPYLVVFKSGYVPIRLHNAPKSQFAELRSKTALRASEISYRAGVEGDPHDPIQDCLWDGMTIRIEPFRGTPEEWFREIDVTSNEVLWQDARYAPSFYEALAAEREYFRNHPLDSKAVTEGRFNAVFGRIGDRLQAVRKRSWE